VAYGICLSAASDLRLIDAVKARDLARARTLLKQKVDVNARQGDGATALHWAVHHDDAEAVDLLIAAGAKADVADDTGATPLHLACVNRRATMVQRLLAAGANPNAALLQGETVLMECARAGTADGVKALLAKGADVNAVSAPPGFNKVKAGTIALGNFTPLMMAAPGGSAELIKTLLDAGAKVNVRDGRGMTPLMLAIATDRQNVDAIRLMIAKGADVNAKNVMGDTALDWAQKNGGIAVIEALKQAGAVAASTQTAAVPPFAPADLRTSAQRSVTLLEKTSTGAAANGGCASCHSHNITDLVANLARSKGLIVDQKAAGDRRQLTRAPFFSPLNMLERFDGPGSPDVPLFAFGGLAASGQEPDRVTDAMLANVVAQQGSAGSWPDPFGAVARPPIEDSTISRTALGIAAIKTYAPPARADYAERLERATRWLASAKPATTEDRNMQLVGLARAGADPALLRQLARTIAAAQRPDGGWSQRPEFKSDAYATGQSVYALVSTGLLPAADPAIQKGIRFLLSTQHADGSWYVRSRSPKFQPFFESGFPYGHDQWISSMATGWAAAALTVTIDAPKTTAQDIVR